MTKNQYYMFLLALFVGVPLVTIGLATTNILENPSNFLLSLSIAMIVITNMLLIFLGIYFVSTIGVRNLSFNALSNFIMNSKMVIAVGVLYVCTQLMVCTYIFMMTWAFIAHIFIRFIFGS
jgi:hypothetical protein